MAHILIWIQVVLVLMPTLWLVLGALENIRAPSANGNLVADVLSMKQMSVEFPDMFAALGRNRITSPRIHKAIFGAIVAFECFVAIVMIAGVIALFLAGTGIVPTDTARIVATLGMLGFSLIWSSFLVGGQWVHYWAGYKDAQLTHFIMMLWGIAVIVVLYL